ncbi:F0F1 ATP synthase subunit B [Facklamia sp. DSM 111018]|uniref:ATP synthase subunit b n=1 Tax=Facklamia lactis TaxID=2749967 RepID=A0ABS0LMK7_9LACT|nr:F0F1 ATP synthase subunit B [Facklamia lactis]MBG9979922.1 F0F1 ATP synthase subunit B [Facklamia lactis]MBG9985398.1 F0F1 ATP synthase subunit B [Facklamia lactis]
MNINLILGEALLTIIAFSTLLIIIYKFAWKPFNETLEARQTKISNDWDAAENAKKVNQEAQAQIEEKLKLAHLEAEQITRQAHIDATHLHDSMLAETRQEQARMIHATEEDLKIQRQQFAVDMQESLVHMASAMAEKILQREIKPEDHQNMIKSFIQRMEELDEQI